MGEMVKEGESTQHSRRKRLMNGKNNTAYGMDDESSTDSGCSSRGSSDSNDRFSRRGSSERSDNLCNGYRNNADDSSRGHHVRSMRLHHHKPTYTSSSHERLSGVDFCPSRSKSSRSLSPSQERVAHHERHQRHHRHHHSRDSSSQSISDGNSTNDDSSSTSKQSHRTDVIRRALQSLKIAMRTHKNGNNSPSSDSSDNGNNATGKDKKQAKQSPKRILRSPVSYTYVKGLSGLPTQRVPRNSVQ